jgi:hypothetical protein
MMIPLGQQAPCKEEEGLTTTTTTTTTTTLTGYRTRIITLGIPWARAVRPAVLRAGILLGESSAWAMCEAVIAKITSVPITGSREQEQ